jgi:hypothetical protein
MPHDEWQSAYERAKKMIRPYLRRGKVVPKATPGPVLKFHDQMTTVGLENGWLPLGKALT